MGALATPSKDDLPPPVNSLGNYHLQPLPTTPGNASSVIRGEEKAECTQRRMDTTHSPDLGVHLHSAHNVWSRICIGRQLVESRGDSWQGPQAVAVQGCTSETAPLTTHTHTHTHFNTPDTTCSKGDSHTNTTVMANTDGKSGYY